jgi:hypothetical protein
MLQRLAGLRIAGLQNVEVYRHHNSLALSIKAIQMNPA